MPMHREQGIGGLQLLPQRLPLLLRQQRPRKGYEELSHPRSEISAAAGTFATDRYRQAAEAGILPVEGAQFVRLNVMNGLLPIRFIVAQNRPSLCPNQLI